ncbi:MAG: ubiquinol-cytochrome c reductase iron-sulfur subunit [Acidimicrobiia bacterium]
MNTPERVLRSKLHELAEAVPIIEPLQTVDGNRTYADLEPPARSPRRLVAAVLAAAAVALLALVITYAHNRHSTVTSGVDTTDLGPITGFPLRQAVHVVDARVFVVRIGATEAIVLSDRSPHLGCRLVTPPTDGPANAVFQDQCHGSIFDLNGDKLSGPAAEGMYPVQHNVINGRITIVRDDPTLEQWRRKAQQAMDLKASASFYEPDGTIVILIPPAGGITIGPALDAHVSLNGRISVTATASDPGGTARAYVSTDGSGTTINAQYESSDGQHTSIWNWTSDDTLARFTQEELLTIARQLRPNSD